MREKRQGRAAVDGARLPQRGAAIKAEGREGIRLGQRVSVGAPTPARRQTS